MRQRAYNPTAKHMPADRTDYVCRNCARVVPREMGKCPQCGEFNSFEAVTVHAPARARRTAAAAAGAASVPQRLSEIAGDVEARLPLAMNEFARVLGGGIVPGSVVLIGGDPGIGKSTLMLQVAGDLSHSLPVLYVSGEESARQIKMRALRLENGTAVHAENLLLMTETGLENILAQIESSGARVVVIDSIQTTHCSDVESAAGSITQVRECAARLTALAKRSAAAIFLVGHVNKEGTLAGPRVLEHMVDTVLYLEGDRHHVYRLLRSVKNRFGPTSELGVFEMRGAGMVEVANPSEAFLAERLQSAPGSAIAVPLEGTRPLLVEVQALASPTAFGNPRRTANGVDFNRLLLVTAVLTRRLGLRLADQDVFVNVIGGMTIEEPAADLAMAAAIASSVRDLPVAADVALVGEVGLSGELRAVSQLDTRLREAAKLGFKRAVVPRVLVQTEPFPAGIEVIQAPSVGDALRIVLPAG